MALLFCDGFDHYNSILQKWTTHAGNNPTFVTGRRTGSNALSAQGTETVVLTAGSTWIVGFAWQRATATTVPVLSLNDPSNAVQLALKANSDGSFSLFRNVTLLGTTSTLLWTPAIWTYLELKVVINSSTGSYDLHQAGVSILSASGTNTQGQAGATADHFAIGPGGSATDLYDDLYILNGSASTPANNNFLGDIAVRALYPTGAGNYAQWTPSTGANWQNVDETPPNEDTDYNSTLTVGNIDSFHLTTIAAGTIYGVQQLVRHRKDDAGVHTIAPLIRTASSGVATDYPGTTVNVSDSYTYAREIHEADPGTSAQWTPTTLNNAEFGYKEIS